MITFQTNSGSGALEIWFEFIQKYKEKTFYLSDPTWFNHQEQLDLIGLKTQYYPYFNPETKSLDYTGMISTLQKAESGSYVLLQPIGHNPSGVDPTKEEWKEIASIMKKNELIPFFDLAHQGFVTGDLDEDAWVIRYFVEEGFQMFVAQSFSKIMGLYGERVGALHLVVKDSSVAENVFSQIS